MKAAASSCRRVGGLTSSHWNTHVHQHNVLWSFVRERSHSSGSCMEPYNSRRKQQELFRVMLYLLILHFEPLASCLVRFLYLCNESNKMLQMCSFWSWVIRHMEQSGFHHLCFSFHLFCVFGGFFEQATVSWAQPTRETAPMPPVRRKVRRSSFQVRAFFWFFFFWGERVVFLWYWWQCSMMRGGVHGSV